MNTKNNTPVVEVEKIPSFTLFKNPKTNMWAVGKVMVDPTTGQTDKMEIVIQYIDRANATEEFKINIGRYLL